MADYSVNGTAGRLVVGRIAHDLKGIALDNRCDVQDLSQYSFLHGTDIRLDVSGDSRRTGQALQQTKEYLDQVSLAMCGSLIPGTNTINIQLTER